MFPCDICEDRDCMNCTIGNPCLGCLDYDWENDVCLSNGGCGAKENYNVSDNG